MTPLEEFKNMVSDLQEEDLRSDLITTWLLQWTYYIKGIITIKPPQKPPKKSK